MPEKLTYLAVDLFSIFFPFLFSFHPKIKFYKHWRYMAMPCLLVALFFILWDMLFTYMGIWSFNPDYLVGVYVFNLPLEELLFFICIPYACIFTYYCLCTLTNIQTLLKHNRNLDLVLALLLLSVGLIFLPRLYTSSTFLLLSIVLLIVYLRHLSYMPMFYLTYILIMLPFFITNGILTGSFINRMVVIYNTNHNLGLRLFTIPVEDVFYGMLLFILNIIGYEYLKNRGIKKAIQNV